MNKTTTAAKNTTQPSIAINPYQYSGQKKIVAENGAVVSAHPLASKVGVEILKMGGNAIDAAIATQLALAVVYPNAGNLGGGGFTVARLSNGELISIDYREKAPDFQPVTCMWMQMEQQEQIKARMAI